MGKDGGVEALVFSLTSPGEFLDGISLSSELTMHSRLQDGGLAFVARTLLSDFEDSRDSERAVCVLADSVSRSLAFSCGAEVVVGLSELVVFVSAEALWSFLSWFSALLLLSDGVLSFFLKRFLLRR